VNVGSAANVSEVYVASIFRTNPDDGGRIYLQTSAILPTSTV
jgi:hypothetical protein